MKTPCRLGLAILISLLFTTNLFADTPYAPIVEVSEANNNSYLKMKLRQLGKKLPKKSEVPVPAYTNAKAFSISNISSSSSTTFQNNNILLLATPDSKSTVTAFYKSHLTGWNHKSLKHGNEVFMKKGEQVFWGGKTLLEGPRVEVLDVSNKMLALKAGVDAMKLHESIPSMKTAIKIYYEVDSSPVLKVNVEKVFDECVAQEITRRKEQLGRDMGEAIQKMAKTMCSKVNRACDKNVMSGNCQKYARLYQ